MHGAPVIAVGEREGWARTVVTAAKRRWGTNRSRLSLAYLKRCNRLYQMMRVASLPVVLRWPATQWLSRGCVHP